jgi:MarR family transcriptional regulator, 2-MHQ and catechol-resistance regulon repressor
MTTMRADDATLTRQARELQDALSEFVRVYQFRDRDQICCHDVSVTQCYALDALLRRGLATLNELAAELCLDKSTASRVVATLERKGYAARSTHPPSSSSASPPPAAAAPPTPRRSSEGPESRPYVASDN